MPYRLLSDVESHSGMSTSFAEYAFCKVNSRKRLFFLDRIRSKFVFDVRFIGAGNSKEGFNSFDFELTLGLHRFQQFNGNAHEAINTG
jgi:hypothetical protein